MNTRPPAPPLPDGSCNRNPPGLSFWQLVREDFETHERDWTSQGFWAVFTNRYGNWRMGIRSRWLRAPFAVLYLVMRKWCQVVCGIKLDYTVELGRRVKLEHFGGMIIGARSIGDDVVIRQNTTIGIRSRFDTNAKPRIGHRVEIGAGAVIVGDVTIGDDCIVGANCVIASDLPPGSMASMAKPDIRPRRLPADGRVQSP